MTMAWTDNPVADFDTWDRRQNAEQEWHRKGKCAHCGEDIYDYSDHYDFDGVLVCDDCLIDWARNFKVGG